MVKFLNLDSVPMSGIELWCNCCIWCEGRTTTEGAVKFGYFLDFGL